MCKLCDDDAKYGHEPSDMQYANLQIAFVQGAAWWEYKKTGATMWASDRSEAEAEASKRFNNDIIWKLNKS